MLKPFYITVVMFILTMGSGAAEDQFNTERLPIGNPKTKYDFCTIKLNRVFDTAAGSEISTDQLISKLSTYRMIMLGESHTNTQHHSVQLNVIRGLVETGTAVCLALEMFTPSQNQALKDYISGKITEEEFLDRSEYFNTWGHNYRYYQSIFNYAREKKITMFGVNTERDYASKVGRGGIESLSREERKAMPQIDTTDIEHRFYFNAVMEGIAATSPVQFRKLYAAQCLWDAAMGEGAIKVAHENPQAVVIILVGSGHVAYNLGIGKIIKKRSEFPFASVLAIDIPDTMKESLMMQVKKNLKDEKKVSPDEMKKQEKIPTMTRMQDMNAMDKNPYKIVIRSLADFLWGVPEEKQEKYPSFGFSIDEKSDQGFKVKRIIPETMAAQKGIQISDIIISIDDKTFPDMAQLKKYLSFKNWDEEISFKILRDGKEMEIKFKIED